LKKDLLIFLLFLFVNNTFSQHSNDTYVTGNIGYGMLLPHKSVVQHLKGKPSLIAEIGVVKHLNSSNYHSAYNKPSIGVNFHFNNTGNEKVIGNGYALDVFGAVPLYEGKTPIQFRTGFGAGYIEKPFDPVKNKDNNAIGGHYNIHIQARFEKMFYLGDQSRLNASLGFSHFSNAATHMPNYGLNFVHFSLGYEFLISNRLNVKLPEMGIAKSITPLSKWSTSINMGWGMKENNNMTGDKFNIYTFSVREEFRVSLKSSFFASVDLYQNYAQEVLTGETFQTGVSIGYFLNFEKFKAGVGMGYYVLNGESKNLDDIFYHKVITEYQISKKFYAQVMLKSHWAAADFFNLTVGYKINEK